jgi:aspartyl protease family protein
MFITRTTVVAVATLSALLAAGGVIAMGQSRMAFARAALPHASEPQPIPRAADGHFWVDGLASSDTGRARIRFLVDTGASSVALTATDARKLGLDTEHLIYSRPVYTAQGQARAAPVMLSRLTIGGAELREVRALVLKNGPQASLLGMSYLGRLSRIEATPDAMTLHR